MNELEQAREIAAGRAPSPMRCGGFALVALRVTGTGLAARPAIGEIVDRNPDVWLAPEMLARVAGLPVILQHPIGKMLDGEEFEKRVVGAVVFPYVADADGIENTTGPNLWAVARVFGDDIIEAISRGGVSTSPAVEFAPSAEGETFKLEGGGTLLRENDPILVDHIALLPAGSPGVWDAGRPGSGVRCDSQQETTTMSETAAAAPIHGKTPDDGDKLDKILAACDSLTSSHAEHGKRLDALCGRMDAMETAGREPKADTDSLPTPEMPPVAAADQRAARYDAERKHVEELAKAQTRWDSVAQAFGRQADRPLIGDSVLGYRKRLTREYQRFSPAWRNTDLGKFPEDAFSVAEEQIRADAMAEGRRPTEVPFGIFREVVHVDPYTGSRKIDFYGQQTIFETMAARPQAVVKFLTPNSRNH